MSQSFSNNLSELNLFAPSRDNSLTHLAHSTLWELAQRQSERRTQVRHGEVRANSLRVASSSRLLLLPLPARKVDINSACPARPVRYTDNDNDNDHSFTDNSLHTKRRLARRARVRGRCSLPEWRKETRSAQK